MSKKPIALVVDDEADIRTYLSALLEDEGFEVVQAANGVECIDKAKEVKPDLITLDLSMPEESGVRSYRTLKGSAELKNIPVFIITGYSSKMRTYLKKLKGFPFPEAFIDKPVSPEELRKYVSEQFQKQ